MSGEGNPEQVQARGRQPEDETPVEPGAPAPEQVEPERHQRRRVQAYVGTLHRHEELSELIVALEGHVPGAPPSDPGLIALVEATGVSLESPAEVRQLELQLGARAAALAGARAPRLERQDLGELAQSLLTVMESARMGATSPGDMPGQVDAAVREALDLYERNLPARDEHDARWWREARLAVLTRALPAYKQVAWRLDALEADPARGLLLRSPLAMAILCGVAGLITFAMPLSTPLVCLALALVGYYLVHPFWVQQVVEPLRAIAENLEGEGDRLERLAGRAPWTEEHCTVRGAVADLLPMLEAERRAGRGSEQELRQVIHAYFDAAEPFHEAIGKGGRSFQNLRKLVEGLLARELARYNVARLRWEGTLLSRVVDTPALAAVAFAVFTLPFAFIASRITPIPAVIDFPLMVAVFAALGYALPRVLPGTLPARATLVERLAEAQGAIDAAP